MNGSRRLSICYLVPGHDLVSSVGPSRNVLNLARAMQPWADVTVAFRRVGDDRPPDDLRCLEIQPEVEAAKLDDAAIRGIGYGEFFKFIAALNRFVDTELRQFDVVLEKSWLLSGYVSAKCLRRGQLGVPVENIVTNPAHASAGRLAKRLRLQVAQLIARRAMRKAPLVIAETEFLKREIAAFWRVPEETIAVVDLGVDRKLFHPIDRQEARARLGLPQDKILLVYVGVLDRTHDLEPAIRALLEVRPPNVELHLVGEGERRAFYESLARQDRSRVVFHGRVAHHLVPSHIATADLCLAPYNASAFSSGQVGYSTLKIPEYLSVGRPVASVPSGRISRLIRDGETGFLFQNFPEEWRRFLSALPSQAQLHKMGTAAANSKLTSWEDTAREYHELVCRQLSLVSR